MSSHPQPDSVLPVADAPSAASAVNESDLAGILENFRASGQVDFKSLVIAAQRAGVEAGVLTLPVVEVPQPVPAHVGVESAPTPAPTPVQPVTAPGQPSMQPPAVPPGPLMGFEAHTPEQMRTLRDAGLLPPGIWERYVEMMRNQRSAAAAARPTAPSNGHVPEANGRGPAQAPPSPEARAMQLIDRLNKVGATLAHVALPLLEGDVALGITLAPDGWIVGSAILEDTEVNGEATRLQHPILGYDNVEFHQLGDVVGRVLRETVHRLRQEQGRG